MHKIFIDGQVGTTGLKIVERLQKRRDIELMEIPHESRKDMEVKQSFLNEADLVILCLPDAAARESMTMIKNTHVKVLDASTAHRVDPAWVYGLPEMDATQRERIQQARHVSVPGCYPTGFLLQMIPLVGAGLIPNDYPVSIHAVSGYSGGGRQLIEQYEQQETMVAPGELWSYRPYGLSLAHKHVPEMQRYSGLVEPPLFVPAVAHFYQGMLVSVPLITSRLKKGATAHHIHAVLSEYYRNERYVKVLPLNDMDGLQSGFLSPVECNGTNRVDLMVYGNDRQILLTARLDNLGKGASGAAVQNLNIMLGVDEETGLE